MTTVTGSVRTWSYMRASPSGDPALLAFALAGAGANGEALSVTVNGSLADSTYSRLMDSGPVARVSVRGEIAQTPDGPELVAEMVTVDERKRT